MIDHRHADIIYRMQVCVNTTHPPPTHTRHNYLVYEGFQLHVFGKEIIVLKLLEVDFGPFMIFYSIQMY